MATLKNIFEKVLTNDINYFIISLFLDIVMKGI